MKKSQIKERIMKELSCSDYYFEKVLNYKLIKSNIVENDGILIIHYWNKNTTPQDQEYKINFKDII